jgi:thioredoxin reductase (NADPH)
MYDLIVIGGGPAGLASAIYSARYMLKTAVLSKDLGGAITGAHLVENYPGFEAVSGLDLVKKFEKQAKKLGVEIKSEEALGIKKEKDHFLVNDKLKAKKIVLATGTFRRKLNIPGEEEFVGKGVSYCATCDAPFFKDKIVGVVGGSNSAVRAAQLLCDYAKKVYIIYRRDKLRAEPKLCEQIEKHPKVEIIYNTNVKEVKGEKTVNSAVFDSGEVFMLDGLFIEIGSVPTFALPKELGVKLSEDGYIVVDDAMKTNVKGVYAAGDITTGSNQWRQVVTACAEGGIAASSAYLDIKKEE